MVASTGRPDALISASSDGLDSLTGRNRRRPVSARLIDLGIARNIPDRRVGHRRGSVAHHPGVVAEIVDGERVLSRPNTGGRRGRGYGGVGNRAGIGAARVAVAEPRLPSALCKEANFRIQTGQGSRDSPIQLRLMVLNERDGQRGEPAPRGTSPAGNRTSSGWRR